MALKSKISKAEYDALSDVLKEHYKADGSNYLLDSDGADELRRAKDREAEEARKAKERADTLAAEKAELEKKLEDASNNDARKRGDIEALENSWKKKLADKEAELSTTIAKLTNDVRSVTIEKEAIKLAEEISIAPELLMPLVMQRLDLDMSGDKPIVRVLDAAGKPSALTITELRKELVENEKFKPIIKASNASGGGAGDAHAGGGASKKISEMSEQERVALYRRDPKAYTERAHAEGLPIN